MFIFLGKSSQLKSVQAPTIGNRLLYHFHFFGDSCETGWVAMPSLIPFQGKEHFKQIQREKLDKAKTLIAKTATEKLMKVSLLSYEVKTHRQTEWNDAIEEAENVSKMMTSERLAYVAEKQEKMRRRKPKKRKNEGLLFIKFHLKLGITIAYLTLFAL